MDNTPHQPPVRDTATVTVSAPVDGTKKRRVRALERRTRTQLTHHVQVDPQVLAAAQAACRPGERFVVSPDGTMRSVYVD